MEQAQGKKSRASNIAEFIFLLLLVFLIRTFGFGLYQVPTGSMETTMLVGERFFADKLSYWFRKPQRNEIIAFNAPPPHFKYSQNKLKRLFENYVWGPANWTKRVIGIPGDRVRGAVEDGKPVVYVNDQKLDEPYLNKYPLISVFADDPDNLREQVRRDIAAMPIRGFVDEQTIDMLIKQYKNQKSYDPTVSYENQPFYRINSERVIMQNGKPEFRHPGTPKFSENNKLNSARKNGNYWNESDEFYVELGPNQYWLMGDNRQGSQDCRFFGPVDGSSIHGRIIFRIWSVDSYESWWIVDLIKHPIDFWSRMRWSRFFEVVK